MSVETYYTVLRVGEKASQAEIKAAYRELIRQVHPDSVPNASAYWRQVAEEKTKEVNEAYSILSDVSKRRDYDKLLAELRNRTKPQPRPAPTPAPRTRSTYRPPMFAYCSACGTVLYASGYCPTCEWFARPSNTPPSKPKQPRPRPAYERVFRFYAFLVGAGVAFGLLRIIWVAWVAFLCSTVLALLCRQKKFRAMPHFLTMPHFLWSCLAISAVSGCFLAVDYAFPEQRGNAAPAAYEGSSVQSSYESEHSNAPCGIGQPPVTFIDNRPCKPLEVEQGTPTLDVHRSPAPKTSPRRPRTTGTLTTSK